MFSIMLTIALIVCLFVVKETDLHMEALKYEYLNGGQDFSVKSLTIKQTDKLQRKDIISHLALSCFRESILGKEKQNASIYSANKDFILSTSKLIKGRLPQKENEIVAEQWVLDNLNIRPQLNSKIILNKILDPDKVTKFQKKKYQLVGIISDKPLNKVNSTMELYTAFVKENIISGDIYADVKLKEKVHIKQAVKQLRKKIQIKKSDCMLNLYAEQEMSIFPIDKVQGLLVILLLCISAIIILGIYQISILNRKSQYGILKAVGMGKWQIVKLFMAELTELYLFSIPIGLGAGFFLTWILSQISKDTTTKLIFWGKEESLQLAIPIVPIFITILGVGIIIESIAIVSAYSFNKQSVIQLIEEKEQQPIIQIKEQRNFLYKMLNYYQSIAIRHLEKEKKTSIFIILSISISCSLFLALYQKANWEKACNNYKKQQDFLNTDFRMEKINDENAMTGIQGKIGNKIEKIKGVKEIDTQMLLPIRVVDNKEVKRNQKYCDKLNEIYKDTYIKSYIGNDGKDSYYKTVLRGYNEVALKKLKRYVIDGTFDTKTWKENEVILWIPKAMKENSWEPIEGYAENGVNVYQYKVGDTITMKYRTDLKTSLKACIEGKDTAKDYTTHTFHIVAIVSFPYMEDVFMATRGYPNLILHEKQFKNIVPIKKYSTINVHIKDSITEEELSLLDTKLISLTLKNQNSLVKNIRNEKMDLERLYKKQNSYRFGIAFVVLYLAFMNVFNNMQYRIYIRKKEINIYRAIGMNRKIIQKMIGFESLILGGISILVMFLLSYPMTKFLYSHTNAQYFNIKYQFDFGIFSIISISILWVIWFLSNRIVTQITKESMIENIKNLE